MRWIVCCGLNRNAPNIAWPSVWLPHANRVLSCIRARARDARRSIGVPGHWDLDYRTPEIQWTRGGGGTSPPPNTEHCICFARGAHVCVCSVGSCSYLWCCFGAGLVENSIFACGRPATGDGLLGIGEGARARVLAWVRALSTRTICWHALSDVDNLFISLTVEAAQTKDPNVCVRVYALSLFCFFFVFGLHTIGSCVDVLVLDGWCWFRGLETIAIWSALTYCHNFLQFKEWIVYQHFHIFVLMAYEQLRLKHHFNLQRLHYSAVEYHYHETNKRHHGLEEKTIKKRKKILCYVYSHFIDIRPTIRTYGAFYGRVFARMSTIKK